MQKLKKQINLASDRTVVKKGINIRIDKETYNALKDIKKANGYKNNDEAIKELIRYVALASYNGDLD